MARRQRYQVRIRAGTRTTHHSRYVTARVSARATIRVTTTRTTTWRIIRRGRCTGSRNYSGEYRWAVVLEYIEQRRRGKERWVAADLVGMGAHRHLHKPGTIEKWARDFGIDIDGI